MTMLIPFWVWLLLGIFAGWKLRGYFERKLSFVGKARRWFRPKSQHKRSKRSVPPKDEKKSSEDDNEEEMTGTERVKMAAQKAVGVLAKPWEKLLNNQDEEGNDE